MPEAQHLPSIFNDVLGPVMRGPSSSHCAAANRIGRLCRDLVGGDLRRILIEYDPNGSLVTTHQSQGTDMGLYGGFLGWETDDARLPDFASEVKASGLEIDVRYVGYGATHPNTYKLTLEGVGDQKHTMTALSTGGGMIEVIEIDGASVKLAGDYCEILVYRSPEANPKALRAQLTAKLDADNIDHCEGPKPFFRVSSRRAPNAEVLDALRAESHVRQVRVLRPVLPILSRPKVAVPFQTVEAMRAYNQGKNLTLWELAADYECARGGISRDEVLAMARDVLRVMAAAIQTGLAGTQYADRILPSQSTGFVAQQAAGRLVPGEVINRIIASVSAIMEVKSSMGVIVAAPTAGSCGAMPGAVLAVAEALGKSETEKVQALLVAGLIGVFVATHATFAAEVGGCMAECGAGSGMAAAAITGLAGGTLDQQLAAASMALQNSLGMVCDPIANRVEAPCLGKNVLAATNALTCANMALANYQHLIPLDEVIQAMNQVGQAIPHALRCTGLGGLSITPTSRKIEQKLAGKTPS